MIEQRSMDLSLLNRMILEQSEEADRIREIHKFKRIGVDDIEFEFVFTPCSVADCGCRNEFGGIAQ